MASHSNTYEIKRDGKIIGAKFTSSRLREMATRGELLEKDLIRKTGTDSKWKAAGSVASFNFTDKVNETIEIELENHTPELVSEDGLSSVLNRSGEAISEIKQAVLINDKYIPDKVRLLLREDEEIIHTTRPSKLALIIKLVVSGFLLVLPILFLGFKILMGDLSMLGIFLCLNIILIILFFVIYYSWKNTYYVITKGRTIAMQGVFNVSVKIIINENIQIISINTGVIDRWLGLNTIKLLTAAQGVGLGSMSPGTIVLKNVTVADIAPHYAR